MTAFSSTIIANYFLHKEPQMKNDIMKVLKMVYIAHGFHLASVNLPLIKEKVMAWQYGPVIPELYFQLKNDNLMVPKEEYLLFEKDQNLKDFLDVIYEKYHRFNGGSLSKMTHQKDTPWDITVNKYQGEINNDIIRDHYLKLLNPA